MGRLAWYKAEPRAFFDATRGWPNELKANYRLVLDLIYANDGALPDDERWVAGELGCDLRVWRRLKAALVERGKLYLADGRLRNPRADIEVANGLAKLEQTITAGLASAEQRRKSEPVLGKNKDLAPTAVPTIKNKKEIKKEPPVSPDGETSPVVAATPKAAVEVWNRIADGVLERVRALDDRRAGFLRKRLADECRGDLRAWEAYCRRIRSSPFLCGENERGWRANIDWAVRAGTYGKVLEGRYDARPGTVRGKPSVYDAILRSNGADGGPFETTGTSHDQLH